MAQRTLPSRLLACVAPALVVAVVAAAAAAQQRGDGRGLATFGDRGLTTFGDRFSESFGTRPLESIGPIPLSSMGGLDTSRRGRKVERDGNDGPRRRPFPMRQRRLVIDIREDERASAGRATGAQSVATLRGAVVMSCDPASRFVLPALPLPPLLLDHARAEQELLASLREEADVARARGDVAAADLLQAADRR